MVTKTPTRVVCWFSCGATSAVAVKLALSEWSGRVPVHIVYCDTRSEHSDNRRFLRDCEAWFGQSVEILASKKYHDIWDVFAKRRFLVGPSGALCTTELKKVLRFAYEQPGDLQVFGYDAGEAGRVALFRKNNPEVNLGVPLYDRGLTKSDAQAIVLRAGLRLPLMYELGFQNANCVGCPKGGMGYWNKVRRVFPDVFVRMAEQERELDVAICKRYENGERIRVFLDELDPDAGRDDEPMPECGLLCFAAEQELKEPDHA